MVPRTFVLASSVLLAVLCVSCGSGGGSGGTPTPNVPGPEQAIADWVAENRNVGFVPNCDEAARGVDTGKVCAKLRGERGTRRAYDLGPTFSQPTALVLVEQTGAGWTVLSVTNVDLSAPSVPGIAWPLQQGDSVLVIGLGENDCLRIREEPTQQGKQLACMSDGTRAIVQEGPVDAETFTWWKISGNGFNGWAAGTWLRLEDAIADALEPQGTPTSEGVG